ncbi:MAG: GvpL/GvpF family gas vesicle protein [Parachlamydiaceae bacterium]
MLLLYCVIRHPNVGLHFLDQIRGLDETPVEFILLRDLLAVVSPISVKSPSPTHAQLITYEKVIASLLSNPAIQAVVPMRYGSFFHTRSSIRDALDNQFSMYDKLLFELNGCIEMGIRFLIPIPPSSFLTPSKIDIVSGKSYLESLRLRFAKEECIPEAIQKYQKHFCDAFSGLFKKYKLECPDSSQNKIDNRLPSLYFLVEKKTVTLFKETFERTIRNMPDEEQTKILLNGPWAPYNFVS